jgi:hypothetical protein
VRLYPEFKLKPDDAPRLSSQQPELLAVAAPLYVLPEGHCQVFFDAEEGAVAIELSLPPGEYQLSLLVTTKRCNQPLLTKTLRAEERLKVAFAEFGWPAFYPENEALLVIEKKNLLEAEFIPLC